MPEVAKLFRTPSFVLKIVEVILAALCAGLVAGEIFVSNDPHKIAVVFATLIGHLMISLLVILGYLFDFPLHKFLNMTICVSGCAMFITAGYFMCAHYSLISKSLQIGLSQGDRPIGNFVSNTLDAVSYTFKQGAHIIKVVQEGNVKEGDAKEGNVKEFLAQEGKFTTHLLASGIVAIVNAVVYAVDAFVTFRAI